MQVLKIYYTNDFASKVSKPPWDFSSNAPKLHSRTPLSNQGEAGSVGTGGTIMDVAASSQSWSALLYGSSLQAVHTYAPWLEDSATSFFTLSRKTVDPDSFTMGNILHDMFVCKFDNVMFCGKEGAGGKRIRRCVLHCLASFVSTI